MSQQPPYNVNNPNAPNPSPYASPQFTGQAWQPTQGGATGGIIPYKNLPP